MSFSEDALGDIKGGWAFTQNTTQEFPQFPARDLNSLQSHKLCKKKGGKKKWYPSTSHGQFLQEWTSKTAAKLNRKG